MTWGEHCCGRERPRSDYLLRKSCLEVVRQSLRLEWWVRCHARLRKQWHFVFLPKLGRAHIAEIAIWLDLKFHQGYPTIGKCSTERAFGKSMILAIYRAVSNSDWQTRRSPRYFFLEVGIGIFRIPHPNDGLFGSIFLAKTAETIFTSSYSVMEMKMSQSSTSVAPRSWSLPHFLKNSNDIKSFGNMVKNDSSFRSK